ncbi:MAG: hypothetical protein MUF08_00625 [Burkholderiaceae bacterium]|jgi:hypothetical protein|nr:hypothetical protein [Burkholderiaceae bacterium]
MRIPSAEALSGPEFTRLLALANRLSFLDLCVLMQRAFRMEEVHRSGSPIERFLVVQEKLWTLEDAVRLPSEVLRELESLSRLVDEGVLEEAPISRERILSAEGAKLVAVALHALDLKPAHE